MTFFELFFIAAGLSMDAFAVSVSSAMTMKNIHASDSLKFAVFFGGFQALMPLLGWLVGSIFSGYVTAVDHWIAFVLLGFIGAKMIYDVFCGKEEHFTDTLSYKLLFFLALATSIDALAVGVTFAFMKTNIVFDIITIGTVTFLLSLTGALIGKKAGGALGGKAEIAGGIILILIGFKILFEHLFF